MERSAINVILGANANEGIGVTSVNEVKNFFPIFRPHGHTEVDTARVYGNRTTEEPLGEADWQGAGITIETKLYPTAGKGMEISHKPADVRRGLMQSLKALNADKFDTFYPTRPGPQHDGYFTRFGISNHQSWEVAQICEISRRNGWIMPTMYQGLYNALHRIVEAELVPCLQHYGIVAGVLHRGCYWNDAHFGALDLLRPVAAKHGIGEAEAALRWLARHSALSKDKGDAVIVGASSSMHLEENLVALEKGPLPDDDVVEALNQGWELARGLPLKDWH
ncbi:NADP-dependent oxidoreductase domain-containing protein [Phyllosticta citriasiana]|uniref:NADP-dependent oxidoreductase domain-containing protein n=1 Tax=Phyllosticta citriasiana TaxID=595635 RepID=A0ABR1KZS9_9PEZI